MEGTTKTLGSSTIHVVIANTNHNVKQFDSAPHHPQPLSTVSVTHSLADQEVSGT